MSQSTVTLDLPLIQEAQAQKHVIHNEAILKLDSLVQPVALDMGRTAPPATPAEGDRHLVGSGASGDWAGRDGAFAVFVQNGWTFHAPAAGWRVHVLAEAAEAVFDGTGWRLAPGGGDLDAVDMLGINASADPVNRLAVAAPATLFTHGGNGHQLKINKAAATDEAALLFQTGYGGRALVGLLGDDDFSFKVSPDGTTFHTGIVLDRSSGAVRFPAGFAGTGSAAGPMGGQVFTITGERNNTPSVGTYLAHGNGAASAAGVTVPFAGKVVAATISAAGGNAGITTVSAAVNQTVATGFDVSVDYTGTGVGTGVADFSGAPLPVAAGDAVGLVCTAVAGSTPIVASLFVAFD